MRKIKVCYAISSLANQGPPNVLYNIIRYMDFEQFDVTILTMVNEPEVTRIEEFRQLPIRIVQMSPNKVQNPLAMYLTLCKRIKEINPDIIHTHCPRSMFLVPFLSKKYKKVETVHIFPGEQQKVMYGKFKGSIVIALSHFFTKRMDLPIACSESVAQQYWDEQHFKMKAIPNGCSLPLWTGDANAKLDMRKKLGMRDDLKYFIFVGRFSHEKHPEMIIQAFEELNDQRLGLVLLGNGDMYDDLKKHESEQIMLPGFRSNVYDYLIASDYYISASDVEGLANTLLESMTVGLPCVLSDIPSHREVVVKAENIQFAYTFDNHNINELKTAIMNVTKLPPMQRAVSQSVQRIFAKHYTAQQMSEEYQEAYMGLVNK